MEQTSDELTSNNAASQDRGRRWRDIFQNKKLLPIGLIVMTLIAGVVLIVIALDTNEDSDSTFTPVITLTIPDVDEDEDGINDYSGQEFEVKFQREPGSSDECTSSDSTRLVVDDRGSASLAESKPPARLIDRPSGADARCEYSVAFQDPDNVLGMPADALSKISADVSVVLAVLQPLQTSEPPVTTTTAPPTTTTTTAPEKVGLAGTTITVLGGEISDEEAGALQDALNIFGARTGINIEYDGAFDLFDRVNDKVANGNPPDIVLFTQLSQLAGFFRDGHLLPLPDNVKATAEANWPAAWNEFSVVDGEQYAVPVKAEIKSLVWYQPARFEANGYEVPQTWDEFKALADKMIANGDTPLCVGIESNGATGWVFTDWVEDLMLRFNTAEDYDAWAEGDLAFSSPEVRQAWNEVLDLWNTGGAVFGSADSIAYTPFYTGGASLVNGDCFMHRQASFFPFFMPADTPYADGSKGAVDVFYFPSVKGDRPVLANGSFAAAFSDRPEVWAVMEYLATSEYASERQKAQKARLSWHFSGFLSAARNQNLSYYTPLEQSLLKILTAADVVRLDASDLMPEEVGSGSFWTEGTRAVVGIATVEEATAAIDASWPR